LRSFLAGKSLICVAWLLPVRKMLCVRDFSEGMGGFEAGRVSNGIKLWSSSRWVGWGFGRLLFGVGILPGVVSERRAAHLVFNPAADRGRAAARREGIHAYLKGRGIGVVWHVTRGSGDAGRIVSGLPDGALVVAVGGDGTVHEVAAACAGGRRVMGVLPVGSGNDYVKALGIGTDLGRALEVVVGGAVRSVDTGEVNGVPFNNGLGIGFDAEVAEGVGRAPALLGGFGGYLWSVGRLLWGMKCHEARLELDGEEVPARTILVAVALGTTYGGRFRLAPRSSLDDGAFDVVWSEEVGRAEVLRLVPAVLRGTHLAHPKIHFARAAEVEVSLTEATPAHVDGEMLPPTRDFRARVLPHSLRVLVP
jgi:diacylglycerol kinase (ATP)